LDTITVHSRRLEQMKGLNLLALILLVVGGLNWGLVGTTGFDLVRAVFGEMTLLTRVVYALVGVAAIYQLLTWRSVQARAMAPAINGNR
jgi:uncharacterized membrane protein YuzA (DUF378 family)